MELDYNRSAARLVGAWQCHALSGNVVEIQRSAAAARSRAEQSVYTCGEGDAGAAGALIKVAGACAVDV